MISIIKSFISDQANKDTFWKLSLEQIIIDFWSKSIANRETFDFNSSNGKLSIVLYNRLIQLLTDCRKKLNMSKIGMRKVQGVPQLHTAAFPRHYEEEETDKSKQAQIEQTYEKH